MRNFIRPIRYCIGSIRNDIEPIKNCIGPIRYRNGWTDKEIVLDQ